MVRGTPRKSLCVALCAGCLTFLTGCPAFAYTVGGGSTGGGPASAPGATPFTFSAKFLDSNGNPIVGTMVTFSMSAGPAGTGCQPTFNPPTAVTDATGTAATTVTLPSGCPGQFVLQAALAGGGTVTLSVVETGGFPNTSPPPPRPIPARGACRAPLLPPAPAAPRLVPAQAAG